MVPLFGAFLCAAPLVARPTVRFGVRVPPEYAEAAVIRRERRGYQWRSAVVAICCTAAVIAVVGHRPWWPGRLILVVEILADFGCFWLARQRITRVKSAEGWFAGRRQTVVADTSWRTRPQPYPVGWLIPAAAVIVSTVIIGVVRYPHLPVYLGSGGDRVATSPFSVFAVVVSQVYVTGMWAGLLVLVHRSRPDLDTADPAASLRGYRKALGAYARAGLILLACIDLSLLLYGLQRWQVYPDGTILLPAPVVFGLASFLVTAVRAGRERVPTAGAATATDRDDDRFWKAGLLYVNRDDPGLLVSARFAVGWTPNFGNPTAWLLIAGFIAVPAGLVIIKLVGA
jgi:uncharacterized membrane protein